MCCRIMQKRGFKGEPVQEAADVGCNDKWRGEPSPHESSLENFAQDPDRVSLHQQLLDFLPLSLNLPGLNASGCLLAV
jgi:hypothetical protein